MKKQCPFCALDARERVEDFGDVVVFEPLNPVVPGHVLVVPKQHVTDFADDPEVTGRVTQVAAEVAKRSDLEYNLLITSRGAYATQTVFHLHVHLVPRQENDLLKLPWSN